jgi:hypothetical protein
MLTKSKALMVFLLVACGSSQPRLEHAAVTEAAPEQASVGEAPECVDDKEQRVSCLSDGDCCAGFVCGKDPELSQHVSYCIYGG